MPPKQRYKLNYQSNVGTYTTKSLATKKLKEATQ